MAALDSSLNILRGDTITISDFLSVRQPTLGEIADYDDVSYYSMVSSLCATPTDYMLFLEKTVGVAYETFPEMMLFAIVIRSMTPETSGILLGDTDLSSFSVATDDDEKFHLENEEGQKITKPMYEYFMRVLREIHGFKKNVKIPGNAAAKRYLLSQAERAEKRNKARSGKTKSVLEPLIVSMVNTEQFKYDYKSVFDLTLYQFNKSIQCVQRVKNYDNVMHGVYAGTVDISKIPKKELRWLGEE